MLLPFNQIMLCNINNLCEKKNLAWARFEPATFSRYSLWAASHPARTIETLIQRFVLRLMVAPSIRNFYNYLTDTINIALFIN